MSAILRLIIPSAKAFVLCTRVDQYVRDFFNEIQVFDINKLNDDFINGAKSLSAKPIVQVWVLEIVTRS